MPLFPTRQAPPLPWLRALGDEGSIQVCDAHGDTVLLIPNDSGVAGDRTAQVVERATTALARIRQMTPDEYYREGLRIAALCLAFATGFCIALGFVGSGAL